MEYRIVIGGCRHFNDYSIFCDYVDMCLSNIKLKATLIIVSGHCTGTDMMAEKYAKEYGYLCEIFPAQWEKYGLSAGPIRNKQMVELSDFVIAFWDGKSKGTKSLIQFAKNLQKPLRVRRI